MKSTPLRKITIGPLIFNSTSPGTTYAAVGLPSYDLEDMRVICASLVADAPTGTSPTLDVKLQDSIDGVNWFDLVAFTQVGNAAGAEIKRVPGPGTSDAKTFARYFRIVAKVGGTTPVYPVTQIDLEFRAA